MEWQSSFRSPSPTTDDETCLPTQAGVGTNADLMHDLDLNLREDNAVYKTNPFTLAKRKSVRTGGKKIGNVVTAEERKNGVLPSYKPTSNQSSIKANFKVSAKRKENENLSYSDKKDPATKAARRSGPKPAARNYKPEPLEDDDFKPRKNKSGWVDKDGNPLPDDPPPRPSILDIIDEREVAEEKKAKKKEQAKEKRKKTMELKKKKADNDKIVFGRFPKGAGPTKEFPILMALEKQKKFSPKSTPAYKLKLKKGEITLSPRLKTHADAADIDDLVFGPANLRTPAGTTLQEAIDVDGTSSGDGAPGLDLDLDLSTPTLVNGSSGHKRYHRGSGPDSASQKTGDVQSRFDSPVKHHNISSSTCTRTIKSLPQEASRPSTHRYDVRPALLPTTAPSTSSTYQPSTITHISPSVPIEGDTLTTASGYPYSSPLAGRGTRHWHGVTGNVLMERQFQPTYDGLKEEEEFRSLDVERLERAAEGLYNPQRCDASIARPIPRRYNSPLPFSYPPRSACHRSPSSEWSTLPTKRMRTLFQPSVPVTSAKFKLPALLPSARDRPAQRPPPSASAQYQFTPPPVPLSPDDTPLSPPRKYAKLTVFTPASKDQDDIHIPPRSLYTVNTIRGSKYAPSATLQRTDSGGTAGYKGRLTLPPGGGSGRYHSGKAGSLRRQRSGSWGMTPSLHAREDTPEAGPSGTDHYFYGPREDFKNDWESAWKVQNMGGVGSIAGGQDEADAVESYSFRPKGKL